MAFLSTGFPTGPEQIRGEFFATYERQREVVNKRLGRIMNLDIPLDRRTSRFAYPLTAPRARRRDRGDTRAPEPVQMVTFDVTAHDWDVTVVMHEYDRMDDQTKLMRPTAEQAAISLLELPEEVAFLNLLPGATSSRLLDRLPQAPDGANLYSATDGAGNDRFGASGGNIVSGQTLTTAAGIQNAIAAASVRARQFKDPRGRPLLADQYLQNIVYVTSPDNEAEIVKAFQQSRIVTAAQGGAETNIIIEAGRNVTVWMTSYLTGNDAYVFFDAPIKALNVGTLMPVRETIEDRTNSDRARDTGEERIIYDGRWAFFLGLPYMTIKLTA